MVDSLLLRKLKQVHVLAYSKMNEEARRKHRSNDRAILVGPGYEVSHISSCEEIETGMELGK